jgi:hypothetical protein
MVSCESKKYKELLKELINENKHIRKDVSTGTKGYPRRREQSGAGLSIGGV